MLLGAGRHGVVRQVNPLLVEKRAQVPGSLGNELRCLRDLQNCPWIVPLIYVASPDRLFLKAGITDLQCLLKSKGPLPTPLRRLIGYQLLRGLSLIHQAGWVHRDIKPANILLHPKGIWIADFGSARTHQGLDPLGPVGSLPYRAPEVLNRGPLPYDGQALDLWAAGCVLAELGLGHNLFDQIWNEKMLREAQRHVTQLLEQTISFTFSERQVLKSLLVERSREAHLIVWKSTWFWET